MPKSSTRGRVGRFIPENMRCGRRKRGHDGGAASEEAKGWARARARVSWRGRERPRQFSVCSPQRHDEGSPRPVAAPRSAPAESRSAPCATAVSLSAFRVSKRVVPFAFHALEHQPGDVRPA